MPPRYGSAAGRCWLWFDTVEEIRRDAPSRLLPAAQVPPEALDRLTAPRAPIAGIDLSRPQLMGILNVTPDSFSDGGEHFEASAALTHTRDMIGAGAALIDVGGESTRPGAREIPIDEEIRRTARGHLRDPGRGRHPDLHRHPQGPRRARRPGGRGEPHQ